MRILFFFFPTSDVGTWLIFQLLQRRQEQNTERIGVRWLDTIYPLRVMLISLILSLLQCSDKVPVKVRNTVTEGGQREMVYNPALNFFLLVEGKKKTSLVVILLFSIEKKAHSSVPSDTEQVPEAQVPPQHR